MPAARHRRVVLYPQGEPTWDGARQRCAELVHWAGGDPQRVIARGASSLEHFAKHVSRLAVLRSERDKPLVVYTETNPARGIIEDRARLEAIAPMLVGAPSIVYVDADEDPHFIDVADALGTVAGDPNAGAIWIVGGRMRFLLVPTMIAAPELLWPRVEALALAERAPPLSAVRRRIELPPDEDAITSPGWPMRE